LTFWRSWVGLPWALNADPRDGRAACCFRTAQATREELGMRWPADRMAHWYSDAQAGAWHGLRWDWLELTTPIEEPEAGALIRFDNQDDSFGVGVLADAQTLLTVRHHGRLIVGPVSAFRRLKLYRLQ
jgi:hypothetical protein